MKLQFITLTFCVIWIHSFAQSPCTDLPQAKQSIFVNRLYFPHLQTGGTIWGDEGGVFADFNGSPQPIAGIRYASLWMGGIDTTGKKHVAVSFPVNTQTSFFHYYPGPYGGQDCALWDRFWVVEKEDITDFRADISDGVLDNPSEAILAWPGKENPYFESIHGMALPAGNQAPFFDADQNGIYDPYHGDFPQPEHVDTSLVPGKIIWSKCHDGTGSFVQDIKGLGFEYDWTTWATTCSDTGVINESVFFSVRVKNTSEQRFDSVILGIQTSKSLGKWGDDYFGTKPDLQTLYIYNNNTDDLLSYPSYHGLSYGNHPPAVAWTALNQPLFKTMYYISAQLCDPHPEVLEPQAVSEYYNILNAHWSNGNPLINDGDGYLQTWDSTQITNFVFTGNIFDTLGWNMRNDHVSCHVSAELVFSIHLGTMLPGESSTFDYAYSFHRDTTLDHLHQVPRMISRIQQLQDKYQQGFAASCPPEMTCSDDCVWPGDANRNGIVSMRDIIPVALKLQEEGIPRNGYNFWGPKTAESWGGLFDNEYDIKHIDCNGDGLVDTNDIHLVKHYLGNTTSSYIPQPDTFPYGIELGFSVSPIPSNSTINVDHVKTSDRFAIRTTLSDALTGKGPLRLTLILIPCTGLIMSMG